MSPLAALLLLALPAAAEPGDPLIGSRVKSRHWKVLRQPRKVEEYSGDVSLRRGPRLGSADWALYDHETREIRARGDVLARESLQDGSTATARGHEAFHDRDTERGWMTGTRRTGRVEFERRHPSRPEPDLGSGERLDWDLKSQSFALTGDVRVHGPEGEASAGKAVYRPPERTLTLEGRRPVLLAREEAWTAAIQAERIVVERRPAPKGEWRGLVRGERRASGWLIFKDRPAVPGK